MTFDEYWSVVGKVSQIEKEIRAKQDELIEMLLHIIEEHAVEPEVKQGKEA